MRSRSEIEVVVKWSGPLERAKMEVLLDIRDLLIAKQPAIETQVVPKNRIASYAKKLVEDVILS